MSSQPVIDTISAGSREGPAETMGDRRVSRSLLLGALGVVYGDIGTSPLYAFREALRTAPQNIGGHEYTLGCVSLIFWTLIIIVTVKYVCIVLRATEQGEGGIVTLTTLASKHAPSQRWHSSILGAGLIGVALFYGDCVLTPSVSVLSAVEGLKTGTPIFEPYIVPLSIAILSVLFLVQRRGTALIGVFFGPVMAAWFALLALAGMFHIAARPDVLAALNPHYALNVIGAIGWRVLFTLGSVFLAVTGGEALYADVGHFNKRIVRMNWFLVVMPALVLSYFGQAALVLSQPEVAADPFYSQFHGALLYPAIALATAATIIASQAVITGAFTLSLQAMQLRLIPRLETRFTSKVHAGQVYVREINWLLAAAVILIVLNFKTSEALANAYGIAVSTTMLVTTLLVIEVAIFQWKWPIWVAVPALSTLLLVDLTFFSACALKVAEGGWVPLLAGSIVFIIMKTWKTGREAIQEWLARENGSVEEFWHRMGCERLPRVPGTAIYLTSRADAAPAALATQVKHNRCLHQTVVLLTVVAERIPRVSSHRRASFEQLYRGLIRATLRFGFAEVPNVPRSLAGSNHAGLRLNDAMTTYFTSREITVPSVRHELAAWQKPIFRFLAKMSANASDYFCLPPRQVVEIAVHIEI